MTIKYFAYTYKSEKFKGTDAVAFIILTANQALPLLQELLLFAVDCILFIVVVRRLLLLVAVSFIFPVSIIVTVSFTNAILQKQLF